MLAQGQTSSLELVQIAAGLRTTKIYCGSKSIIRNRYHEFGHFFQKTPRIARADTAMIRQDVHDRKDY